MDILSIPSCSRREVVDDTTSASEERSEATAGRAVPRERSGGRAACRVLVVDDDFVVRDILVRLLQQAGYVVATAADGEEGWAALRSGNFDLLLTDNCMPQLTGMDLIRRLRAEGFTLPAILVSGMLPWDFEDVRVGLLPLTFLEKPFGCDTLWVTVGAALRASSAMPLHACEVAAHA